MSSNVGHAASPRRSQPHASTRRKRRCDGAVDHRPRYRRRASQGGAGRPQPAASSAAVQLPCALWQGLDRLEAALAEADGGCEPGGPVAVTMTGELADLFPDRADGVAPAARRHWPPAGPAQLHGLGRRRVASSTPPSAAGGARRSPRPTGWPRPSLAARRAGRGRCSSTSAAPPPTSLVLAGGAVAHEGVDRPRAPGQRRAGLYRPHPHAA